MAYYLFEPLVLVIIPSLSNGPTTHLCTRMHLSTSIQIPSCSDHLESDRDTPKVSEAGGSYKPAWTRRL